MIAEERVKWRLCCKYLSSPLLHISQPPLPTVSHLGLGSIHPDGGFIFVFVCLLIHASSYSGHRWGFRSSTECKSPWRLIHFHLSLVDIQLFCTFLPVSRSQDILLFLSRMKLTVTRPAELLRFSLLHACEMWHIVHLPLTFASDKIFFPLC